MTITLKSVTILLCYFSVIIDVVGVGEYLTTHKQYRIIKEKESKTHLTLFYVYMLDLMII